MACTSRGHFSRVDEVGIAEEGARSRLKEFVSEGRYQNYSMPPKTPSSARRTAAPRKKPKEGAIEIVVRRGALRRFDALKTRTGELPVVVTWDRRTDERRDGSATSARERRLIDRRQKPPFTWDLADFVVVERRPQRKTRKKKARKS